MINESKFSNVIVDLPSRGKVYPVENPLSMGTVEMKYGSATEENILLNDYYITKKIVFDKLLESLIINKSINIEDMIIGDRNALLIAARRAMYGDIYTVKVNCPRCDEQVVTDIDLSDLKQFVLDESINENLFKFKSKLGNEFTYKLLSYREDKEIEEMIKKQQKLNLIKDSQTITARLSKMIIQINDVTDKLKIKQFVESMPSIESSELRKDILKNTPDIDMRFDFNCMNCGFEDKIMIPLNVEFFWITGRE